MVSENEEAIVRCETTAGSFSMKFYRSWSPNGYDRAIELFERKFYDNSYFFRVVPKFLVQFGISYIEDKEVQKLSKQQIPDDPSKGIKFNKGTISFAGSGPNSRTSHLFIAYGSIKSLGKELWETALGEVIEGMENVENLYSYGDMPPWGKGPPQGKVYIPGFIEENFPKSDKFLHCKVERLSDDVMAGKIDGIINKEDGGTDEEQFAKDRQQSKKVKENKKQEQQLRQPQRRDLRPTIPRAGAVGVQADEKSHQLLPDHLHKEQLAVPSIPESFPVENFMTIGCVLLFVLLIILYLICGRRKKIDSKSN